MICVLVLWNLSTAAKWYLQCIRWRTASKQLWFAVMNLFYLYVFLLSRFLIEAPFSALAGVVADVRDPPKVSFSERAHNNL